MHRNSAGFLTLPVAGYAAIAAILVIAGLGVACKVQTSRLDALRHEYDAFKGGVEALGLAAKKAAAEKEAADIKRKADTDALHQASVDALNADIRRLRTRSPSPSFVSAATSCPGGAAGATEFRAEYQRSYGALVAGLRGLGDEGSKATVDLNSAKTWAQH